MKAVLLVFLCSVLSVFGVPPAGYYDSAVGKSGPDLRLALHEIINDHTALSYSSGTNNTEVALKVLDQDSANTNNVLLLYAQRTEPKSTFGLSTGWNREHQWPNSFGLDDIRPSYTDLFNLRAEDATVNSARGNKLYDISNPSDPAYRNPAHAEAPLNSTDSDSWEPPNVVKGDIARVIFYMDVRYEGDRTNEVDLILKEDIAGIGSATNLMGKLSALLLWHEQDPVDDSERLRNDMIFDRYQHNRNPFVDHPEWVELIFKPGLRLAFAGSNIEIFWPIDFTNAVLQASETVTGSWSNATGPKAIVGNEIRQTESVSGNRFFRLKLR